MDCTRTNVIKAARASLLLPSRPKTPQVNNYHRKITLLPLDKPVTDLEIILERLQSKRDNDETWNTLVKISQEEEMAKDKTRIILEFLVIGDITRDKWKILRNLSFKVENHSLLVRHGIFQVLNQELRRNSKDLLIITDIYRNLASNSQNSDLFFTFFQIIQDIDQYLTKEEVWFNILRICAKLSLLPVYNDFWIRKFLNLLSEFTSYRELVTRILFTLGNLTMNVGIHEYFNSYDLFFLLDYYSSAMDEEVLIRIIRLYTNLALDNNLGKRLCTNPQLLLVIDFLESENEEMILNTMAFLANYTFFREQNNVFLKDMEYLCKVIHGMMTDNEEITAQGIRIICNISNTSLGKSLITQDINLKLILAMMDHPNRDVVYYTTCTLLNVSLCVKFAKGDLEFLSRVSDEWSQDEQILDLLHRLLSPLVVGGTL